MLTLRNFEHDDDNLNDSKEIELNEYLEELKLLTSTDKQGLKRSTSIDTIKQFSIEAYLQQQSQEAEDSGEEAIYNP